MPAPANAPEDKPYTDPVCGMKAAANPDKSAIHAGSVGRWKPYAEWLRPILGAAAASP